MDDYRETVIDAIFDKLWVDCPERDWELERNRTLNEVNDIVYALPSVDVEPVRYGRWIKGGYACGETEWICSECGFSEWRTSNSRMIYCMHCGARMDGGQDG